MLYLKNIALLTIKKKSVKSFIYIRNILMIKMQEGVINIVEREIPGIESKYLARILKN